MTKLELLEQFDKAHKGTYTIDDLAMLIVEAYTLGELEIYKQIQQIRKLYDNTCKETINGCSSDLEVFLSNLREALDGEQ